MTGVLIKKQFNELFKSYFVNPKTGKMRNKSGVLAFFVLFAFVIASIGYAFYSMAAFLAESLIPMGMTWLYYSILGLTASVLGIVGSVFNTYNGLYHAKDNELLLSMPIRPVNILISRIVSVYLLAVLYTAPIYISSVVAVAVVANPNVHEIIIPLLLMVVLAFFVTAVTCLLGWVVASISGKLKNKNAITVILSLALIGGYYYMTSKVGTYLTMIVSNAEAVGAKIKAVVFPFYTLGKACAGSLPYAAIFVSLSLLSFMAVCLVLSFNFIKITTTSSKTVRYKIRKQSAKSVKNALLNKELKRFVGSPTYMLNCGLGMVFTLAASVILIVKADYVSAVFVQFKGYEYMVPVIATAAIFLMCGTSDISAPSISLEGKNIWILKSLPVSTEDILKAKVKLHVELNIVPTLIFTVVCGVVFKVGTISAVLMAIAAGIYVVFSAIAGVMLNLKFPNLNWTNETMPIKQSLPVFISLFGGWGIAFLVGGSYYFLGDKIDPSVFLVMVIGVFAVLTVLLYNLMVSNGKQMFEDL